MIVRITLKSPDWMWSCRVDFGIPRYFAVDLIVPRFSCGISFRASISIAFLFLPQFPLAADFGTPRYFAVDLIVPRFLMWNFFQNLHIYSLFVSVAGSFGWSHSTVQALYLVFRPCLLKPHFFLLLMHKQQRRAVNHLKIKYSQYKKKFSFISWAQSFPSSSQA